MSEAAVQTNGESIDAPITPAGNSEQPPVKDNSNADTRSAAWWIAHRARIEVFCSITNAVAVVAAVVFSSLVWRDNRESGEDAKARTELEMRPWVLPNQAVPEKPFGTVDKVPITVDITNTGRTPARNIQVRADPYYSFVYPIPKEVKGLSVPHSSTDSTSILGNSGMLKVTVYSLRSDVSQMKLASHDRPLFLFVIGTIDYDDVFGKHHKTEFSYYRNEDDEPSALLKVASAGNSIN